LGGGGGLPLAPPVRDTLGGAVEGATGVVGGTVDAVAPALTAALKGRFPRTVLF
jgi:hypothetical protein